MVYTLDVSVSWLLDAWGFPELKDWARIFSHAVAQQSASTMKEGVLDPYHQEQGQRKQEQPEHLFYASFFVVSSLVGSSISAGTINEADVLIL